MTPRLLQLYETLAAWPLCHPYPPTLAELARACGLKQWQCYAALVGLRARGLVDADGREGADATIGSGQAVRVIKNA